MFKFNINKYFFKNKLILRKNFFFKNKMYFYNKKLLLDSFFFKNKKEFAFVTIVYNTKFNEYLFRYLFIINFYKKILSYVFSSFLKKLKYTGLFYKLKVINCNCFFTENGLFLEKNKNVFKIKRRRRKLNRINQSLILLLKKYLDNDFMSMYVSNMYWVQLNYMKLFLKKKSKKPNKLFKNYNMCAKAKLWSIFRNTNKNEFKVNVFYNKFRNYLFFIKNLNIDHIFNNPYLQNTFVTFNSIKYYSNERLVKQPVCILNYKLTSNYSINNSTRILKNYVYSKKKNVNYHIFLKKFLFNLKTSSYKYFALEQSYSFFNFVYKTNFKLFV